VRQRDQPRLPDEIGHVGAPGFVFEHVQARRVDLAGTQRGQQRRLVDDAATGGVDQRRRRFHGA
jgi:hypothetical protein